MQITVTIDRGRDIGQHFGSLFEATSSDGVLVLGAGFQGLYNTRYPADRHAVQFFVRPTDGKRAFTVKKLPRPNDICGTYLHDRDGVCYSTYGGFKAWDPDKQLWKEAPETGEAMRIGDGLMQFAGSEVKFNGKTILSPPAEGSYQLFYYANGYLCFYHVNRRDGGYRPYQSDKDGFSKLYACSWTPGDGKVDLSRATVHTLPVVGETTFAWGQLGKEVLTGSNIGGFYVFDGTSWRMLIEPDIDTSYQLYSTLVFHDRLLMGQYPTGLLFEYDGEKVTTRKGWPPRIDGVSGSAREAQTTVIYGGDVFVGVWPWGELWRYNPEADRWTSMGRMFDHPTVSDKIVHPYDVESNVLGVGNQWGQRVTSLVTLGSDLLISTSAKWPCPWEPRFDFLADGRWKSYGTVYRLTMPGHLSAPTTWTTGPTRIQFTIAGPRMTIAQDGKTLAETALTGPLAKSVGSMTALKGVAWGTGTYGPFGGRTVTGTVGDR